jgi:hypothetical protein
MIPMGVRFILDDKTVEDYKAWLLANHQVLLTVPSWDYCPLYNRDEIVNQVDSNVTDAMDDARHATPMKKTRQLASANTSCSSSREGTSYHQI